MILEHVDVKLEGGVDILFPKMMKIEQHFNRERVDDMEMTIRVDMRNKLIPYTYKNKRIAMTAGSRGIANLPLITRTILDQLKEWGAKPFIVPAMGSHGGATAEGQREVLADYGITEEAMGAPIFSSMEVVKIANLENGMPVFCDKVAREADGIVVINRIKPHADFKAEYESGLLKMMAIGLGKHKGANILHHYGFDQFGELIPKVAKVFLNNALILFGVAIIENAYEETIKIEIIPQQEMIAREKELLIIAKENMPKFFLSSIDLLIVEEIGKDISGEGMDPNVTGRPGSGLPGFSAPPIQKIVVLGLSEKSRGNGAGIGMADIITARCINQIDFNSMYINSITAATLNPAKIPIVMNTDKEALAVALKTCSRITPETAKIVRIKNTVEMHQIEVSEAYMSELKDHNNISILSAPQPIRFSEEGWLI